MVDFPGIPGSLYQGLEITKMIHGVVMWVPRFTKKILIHDSWSSIRKRHGRPYRPQRAIFLQKKNPLCQKDPLEPPLSWSSLPRPWPLCERGKIPKTARQKAWILAPGALPRLFSLNLPVSSVMPSATGMSRTWGGFIRAVNHFSSTVSTIVH